METNHVEDVARSVEDRVGERVKEMSDRLGTVSESALGFIKMHPMACLGGAFVVGYLLARAARHA